jgi:hypothetical protein
MIRVHDVLTNDVIDREMTNEEFAQYEADNAERAAQAAVDAAKAEAKASAEAKLSSLGLTAEEIAALTK